MEGYDSNSDSDDIEGKKSSKNKKEKEEPKKRGRPSKKDKASSADNDTPYNGVNNRLVGAIYLCDLIKRQKRALQGDVGENRNGITATIIGASGCGKSTMVSKVFMSDMYSDDKFIQVLFTNSPKSDALKQLHPSVIVSKYGVDDETVRWCYQMNLNYEKQYNFVLYMDDVIDFRYNVLIQQMFLIMRNTNITSICSLQYPNYIPPAIRQSAYFTFCFSSNNHQGIELCVRYYLAGYLPGKSIREKMDAYRDWTEGGEGKGRGHRFFLLDNLNHTCFKVDEDYMCYQLDMIRFAGDPLLKSKKSEDEFAYSQNPMDAPSEEDSAYMAMFKH